MGVQGGLEECKHQFAWDRWNCPDSATQLRGLRRGELTRMQASSDETCVNAQNTHVVSEKT